MRTGQNVARNNTNTEVYVTFGNTQNIADDI